MGSVLSYLTIFIKSIITIIYIPIMIKYLGDSEYGVYNLTYSVVSYLSLLSLGFGGAYVRFYYRYKNSDDLDNIKKLNGLFITIYSIMAVVVIIVGYLLINNISLVLGGKLTDDEIKLSANLMKIMVINIAISFPDSVFNSYIIAKEHFIFQRAINLIRFLISPFLGIPLLLMGYRSMGLALSITIATFASLIINMYYAINKLHMKFSIKDPDLFLLKEIIAFSGFIFIGMIIDQINWQIDKVVLGKVVGSVSVAIYSVGSLINQLYMQFSTAISDVFVPKVNDLVTSRKENRLKNINRLFIKIGRIQLYMLMLVLICFFVLGKYFITNIWIDYKYKEAYYVGLILISTITIPLIQNLGIEVQKALNKHKFRSITYFFISLLNILISIPLARLYGPIGSAIGTGISTILGHGIIMNWYYYKYVGINIVEFWTDIFSVLKGMTIPIILAFILKIRGINNIYEFILISLIIFTTYIVCIWKFSFNDFEKELVLSFTKRTNET